MLETVKQIEKGKGSRTASLSDNRMKNQETECRIKVVFYEHFVRII